MLAQVPMSGQNGWLCQGILLLVSSPCVPLACFLLCRYLMAMQHKRKFPIAVANVSGVMEGKLFQNPTPQQH